MAIKTLTPSQRIKGSVGLMAAIGATRQASSSGSGVADPLDAIWQRTSDAVVRVRIWGRTSDSIAAVVQWQRTSDPIL
jgi:hypothetical protein